MNEFVSNLKKELEIRLQKIETKEADMLKKSLEASHVLGEAFDRLKQFILSYEFQDAAEEIKADSEEPVKSEKTNEKISSSMIRDIFEQK